MVSFVGIVMGRLHSCVDTSVNAALVCRLCWNDFQCVVCVTYTDRLVDISVTFNPRYPLTRYRYYSSEHLLVNYTRATIFHWSLSVS